MPANSSAVLLLLAWAMCAGAPAGADTITVSAAISLTDALRDAGAAYTAAGGDQVRFNFAASNVLSRQIAAGAPVDLFVSADDEQMALAIRAGAIDAGTRVSLLTNQLALITRTGLGAQVPDARALARDPVRRIAMGDPAAVPAGVYAKQYLQAIGVWPLIQSKIVPVANPRAALAAVVNATADAAFVYITDARMSRRVEIAFVVSGPAAPSIRYLAAVTAGARHRAAAARFLAWLQGPEAQAVFVRHGFGVPPGGQR